MSDFSFSVRCPYCGGRFAPNDGSCCEPPEEGEEEGCEELNEGMGSKASSLAQGEDDSSK